MMDRGVTHGAEEEAYVAVPSVKGLRQWNIKKLKKGSRHNRFKRKE